MFQDYGTNSARGAGFIVDAATPQHEQLRLSARQSRRQSTLGLHAKSWKGSSRAEQAPGGPTTTTVRCLRTKLHCTHRAPGFVGYSASRTKFFNRCLYAAARTSRASRCTPQEFAVFLWLLKAAKKELTLPPSLSAEQLRSYTGYAQPEVPSPYRCAAPGSSI